MSHTTITDIGTVGIPVTDQDQAVEFFVTRLGFEKRLDVRMGESFPLGDGRGPGRVDLRFALIARPDAGTDTGVRFLVPDAEAEHTAMHQRGIAVGELLRWPGCPAHVRLPGSGREPVRDRRKQRPGPLACAVAVVPAGAVCRHLAVRRVPCLAASSSHHHHPPPPSGVMAAVVGRRFRPALCMVAGETGHASYEACC